MDCHSSVVKDGQIYIFGGNIGFDLSNDFFQYNIDTNSWTEITGGEYIVRPSPRHSHSAVVNGEFMHVFGGHDNTKPRNDLFHF